MQVEYSPEQKAFRAGVIWAQAWLEPNAGSEMAAIASKAIRDGDDYVISGQTWSSGASFADLGFGLFRTDPESTRHRGLSFILFDLDAPDITRRPIRQLHGDPAFADIFFDHVPVPVANRIAGEGEDWKTMAAAGFESRLMLRSPAPFQGSAERLVELCRGRKERLATHLGEQVLEAWMAAQAYAYSTYDVAGKIIAGVKIGAESSLRRSTGPRSIARFTAGPCRSSAPRQSGIVRRRALTARVRILPSTDLLKGNRKMSEAYIVDAIRTPTGRKKGSLAQWHPADLGAFVLRQVIERNGLDPLSVDDVVWGCVDAIGPQAGNIGRSCWLAAGLPEEVPGVTIDRQCGSSQQAIHFAAQGILSGTQDLVIAGGVQNMNAIPISSAMYAGQAYGYKTPFDSSRGWTARYGSEEVNQIYAAEKIAERWDISRRDMEDYAVASNSRAERAIDEGRFDRETVPVGDFRADETVRRGTTNEGLARLKPVREGGMITAGVSSQISDGAAAILIASAQAVKDHALRPRARIHHLTVRGDSPIFMLTAPIPATRHALAKTGMKLDDIDLIEINEAFASVVLAWARELDADLTKVNVNGGAIALGHPLGATGARLMTTLLHELERSGGRYGLQTMCEGGGLANVTIIERLDHGDL